MNKNKAFSLVELSIAMAIAAILLAAVTPVAVRSVETKAAQKTAQEIAIIQRAAGKFYADKKSWPASVPQLQLQGYINPQWNGLNPWGSPYSISSDVSMLSVSVTVPVNVTGAVAALVPTSSINGGLVTSVMGGTTDASIAVYAGMIVAWSGAMANIPSGWALCDGANGTPDLRDRFIVGARQDNGGVAQTMIMGTASQTGGSVSHDHGGLTGNHVLTIAEIPSHHHDINFTGGDGNVVGVYMSGSNAGGYDHHQNTADVGGGQGHTHTIASDYNVPPYYALAFIMKL